MRTAARSLAVVVLLFGCMPAADPVQGQQAGELDGTWKLLILLPSTEYELSVIEVQSDGDKLQGEVIDTYQAFGEMAIQELAGKDAKLRIEFESGDVFTGATRDGDKILGTINFRGTTYAGRLDKTDADATGTPRRIGEFAQVSGAAQNEDAKARLETLETLLPQLSGGLQGIAHAEIVKAAAQSGMDEQQVREKIDRWQSAAEAHGPAWLNASRLEAVRALDGEEKYAALALELAQQADEALGPESPLEQQAAAVQSLARAALAAEKPDLAADAQSRLAKLDARLDQEYYEKVPPFEPEKYGGRSNPENNRVVLMELFTGAQCPPCVAADVAFDALIETYQPSELVTLQYHLHIPGPDPLTNEDAVARAGYYGARGTPSTFFNGELLAPGGGSMSNAEAKYKQYREIIEERLDQSRQAKIDLRVTRSGDEILVHASASAESEQADTGERKLRLRLALVEDSIRYVGGNKLRFHHHVVRAMPGGPEGKELVAGQAEVETAINPQDVRKELASYLEEYAQERSFPADLPDIALEKLSVAAFVQDDSDKRVLHAVVVPVPDAK